ncbi:MAG: electron transfer flavoprotein subunit beta/FixA family protein [Candidatus Kariarchaeaceae archaeon]|jgi:electron transfer flavoprotein beta subunit
MSEGLNIVVLVKIVPKPEEVKLNPETNAVERAGVESIINPPDKNAVETAVDLKERYGGKVTLMTMAPPIFDEFLHQMMAMGADETILLSDREFALADTYPTTMVLAEGIKRMGGADLVICGEESADGGTGNVPPGVAEWLGYSQATYIESIDYDANEERFTIHRSLTNGHEIVSIPKPAVVAVELGINSPRFPDFAKKKELDTNYKMTVWGNDTLNLNTDLIGLSGSHTLVEGMETAKGRDRKKEKISGSSREIAEKLAEIILENM